MNPTVGLAIKPIEAQEIDQFGNLLVTDDSGVVAVVQATDILARYQSSNSDYAGTQGWIANTLQVTLSPGALDASLVTVQFNPSTGQVTAFSISNPVQVP